MYKRCLSGNKYCTPYCLIGIDNRQDNKGIPVRYNEFLAQYDYGAPAWFVFCHEDWQVLEDIGKVLQGRDRDTLYGTIGVKYEKKGEKGYIHSKGRILQCDKDGSREIRVGIKAHKRGDLADTADCQCVIVHSDLIKKTGLRFDEHLSFDFYVEEFCIQAQEKYGIPLKIIPLKSRHYSYGNIQQRFYDAVNYVQEKYQGIKRSYASTVNQIIIGPDFGKEVKEYRGFWENFWFQKKITKSGKLLIKICKIPLPITIKKSIFNGDKKTKYKILGMTVLKIINNDDFCQKEFCFYSKIDFFYHNCNHLTIDTLKRASLLRPTKLFFDLSLGGGTESYFYQTKDDLLNTFNVIRIQYISAIKYYKISLYNGAGTYVLWVNNFFKLRKIIGSLQLDEVILNHIIGFPDIFTILDMISQFKGKTKISARAHDYFSVCPSLNLMIKDVFCGGPEIHKCKHCFSSKIVEKKLAGIKTKSINIEQWRNKWNNFYTKIADELIVFSNSSLNLFKNAYPEINNIKVVPHKIQPLRKVNIRQHQRINIAILGMITGIAKGELVINHIEKIVPAYKNVKIFVFGCYQNNSNAITVLGKYKREELPRLMEEYNIDIVFIPSVCPETFSYTTSEAMTMGLPVACFNIGAQAEKIKKYQKGLIISEINAQIALNDIINFIRKEKTAC